MKGMLDFQALLKKNNEKINKKAVFFSTESMEQH